MNLLAITIDGTQLLLACTGIILAIVLLIAGWRRWLSRKSREEASAAKARKRHLSGRNKYAPVDIFRWRGTLWRFGLSVAIGMCILAFNWTTYDPARNIGVTLDDYVDLDQAPPITKRPPPPPPIPPQPIIEPVIDEQLLEEEELEFEDRSIDKNTDVVAPEVVEKPTLTPPPPPPEEPEAEDEFFLVVEEMPSFGDCAHIFNKEERKACSDRNLLTFISKNIKYPTIARENGIEGQAVIRFIVEKDGRITETEIVRDLAGGCGKEALRVVNLMNNRSGEVIWHPGKQQGRKVRVQFNLPIRFQLQ